MKIQFNTINSGNKSDQMLISGVYKLIPPFKNLIVMLLHSMVNFYTRIRVQTFLSCSLSLSHIYLAFLV